MANSLNLDSLPFDIFYQIATLLDDSDSIHLSRTNRAIHALMTSDLIAHKIVTVSEPELSRWEWRFKKLIPAQNELQYSKEGRSATAAQAGYREAVGHRFDIHEAVATAAPYSVSVVAFAADFLYEQGVLCYRIGHEIRLLDIHHGADTERVLDLRDVLSRLEPRLADKATQCVSLLHYSDGILVFRVHGTSAHEDSLLAIDMNHHTKKSKPGRLLLRRSIPASVSIFVRHTRSYIWYGTFTATGGSAGVWRVRGVDFATQEPIEFTLDPVVTDDLGKSLCFEMYQEHLYAVSTQSTFEEDERFSSFYHWSCYAPRDKEKKASGRIWRREHVEGPINEMWTDLSIQVDDTTGEPVILECRREWRDGKSENHRTTYTQPLPRPEEALAKPSKEPPAPSASASAWVESELATSHHPYNQRPTKRLRRNYHAEYEANHDPSQRQEFIAARTKHHSYHLAAATFIDLVNDPSPHKDGVRTQDQLRLRTISRKRKCPIDEEGTGGPAGLLFPPTQTNANGVAVEGSEDRFVSRGVHLWPAADAPSELRRLLCPDAQTSSIRAVSDERSLVYSVSCAGLPPDHQALVLISFDPKMRLSSLTSLRTQKVPAVDGPIFPVDVPRPRSGSGSLVRESETLHQAIGWGYWLR